MKSKIGRSVVFVLLLMAGIGLVTVGHGKMAKEETWPTGRSNPAGPRN